ncbi:hypothetical protein LTR84_006891 [Exophiala bonariae]|uniref:Spindle pole body-associated protein cut12 domain-containing protein n=1 Tax=Exophiala bonariae TaxID=1690606 RepID=A0AAV9N0T8_9EURO|nr:hypothetical protein LTR84_006891 [Exophiala bonariae]
MATLFSARRKPKRIARDDPEPEPADGEQDQDTGPVVRRPTSNAPKTKSKLRVSFNPGDGEGDVDVGGGQNRSQPSHTSTSGEAIAKDPSTLSSRTSRLGLSSAAQKLQNRGSGLGNRDTTTGSIDDEAQNHDRPTYSKAYLDELRNSTPSTPRDLSSRNSPGLDLVETSNGASDPSNQDLDLASKFGISALSSSKGSSRIPTATEIREKKERRARLAQEELANASAKSTSRHNNQEEDFIPLEAYDSDGEFKPRALQVGSYLAPSGPEKDTRLVRDDEDIAEGFESFVEDSGRVTLSKKALKAQSRLDREAVRSLINEAEGAGSNNDGSDDSDAGGGGSNGSDSDYARHQAYETAQTHRGMDGLSAHHAHTRIASRPRQPRETTAIPKLSVGLAGLRDLAAKLEYERARIEKRRADIRRERAEIVESQAHIQTSLEEAGSELERITLLHRQTQQQQQQQQEGNEGLLNGGDVGSNQNMSVARGGNGLSNGLGGQNAAQQRGLESFGNTIGHPT